MMLEKGSKPLVWVAAAVAVVLGGLTVLSAQPGEPSQPGEGGEQDTVGADDAVEEVDKGASEPPPPNVSPAQALKACQEETENPCQALELCTQAAAVEQPTAVQQPLADRIAALEKACEEVREGLADGDRQGALLPEHITDPIATIEPGRYLMGSPNNEEGRVGDELPHDVAITRSFIIQTTEVTQGQWQDVMGDNPSFFPQCGSVCPVDGVTWYESVAYANALSKRDGLPTCYQNPQGQPYTLEDAKGAQAATWPDPEGCAGWRLPTEAEWEYAARAGSTRATTRSDRDLVIVGANHAELLDQVARYGGNSTVNYAQGEACSLIPLRQYEGLKCGTFMVGVRSPNAWGLYDVLGNVWEWVWDEYGPYQIENAVNPTGPRDPSAAQQPSDDDERVKERVSRGCSWISNARHCRLAFRGHIDPGARTNNQGLRLVRLNTGAKAE